MVGRYGSKEKKPLDQVLAALTQKCRDENALAKLSIEMQKTLGDVQLLYGTLGGWARLELVRFS